MPLILGIDLGSSQLKLLVMNHNACFVDVVTVGYETETPDKGHLIQHPASWERALQEGMKKLGNLIDLSLIEAISFSGHMSGVVLLDGDGEVLYPCIMLADSRSDQECIEIQECAGAMIMEMTGNPIINAFSLPKLVWLKKHEPDCYDKAQVWLSPKDYIRFLLTGKAETEYTDAYNSLCVDRKTGNWSSEIIAAVGLDQEKFPDIHAPFECAGVVSEKIAVKYGLKKGVPIYYGAADMACGAVGNGLFDIGDSTLTLGTCATFLAMVPEEETSCYGKITFHMHVLPDRVYALGSHFNGGLAINWFSSLLSETGEIDYELIRKLSEAATTVPAGSCGLLTLPFLAGSGSPYFSSEDSQSIFGIHASTTRAQLFRSLLEGITCNLRQSLEVFEFLCKENLKPVVLGGGGIKVEIWPQIIADMFNLPMQVAKNPDASSIGAALIGGYGSGIFTDLKQSSKQALNISEILLPIIDNREIYERVYIKYLTAYEVINRMGDQ